MGFSLACQLRDGVHRQLGAGIEFDIDLHDAVKKAD
jgi:hypothetical protein